MTGPRELCGYDYPHGPHKGLKGPSQGRCPGVKGPKGQGRLVPARERAYVLRVLRDCAGDLQLLVRSWVLSGAATVYVGKAGEWLRPRKWDEYAEQDPSEWRLLEHLARKMARRLELLADHAAGRAGQVRALQHQRDSAAQHQQRLAEAQALSADGQQ